MGARHVRQPSAACRQFSGLPGRIGRHRLSGVPAALGLLLPPVGVLGVVAGGEPVQLAADEVPGGQLADGDPQRGQLAGQELGVGLGLRRPRRSSSADPVAVVLAVLGQQDQRRGVGGLGGEGQVEQDERVGVPAQLDGDDVEGDPDDDDDRLDGQEAAGAQEPGDPLGEPAERVGVAAAGSCRGRARPAGGRRAGGRQPRRARSRQSSGSRWSSTSSTLTAPSRWPCSSTTGAATRL